MSSSAAASTTLPPKKRKRSSNSSPTEAEEDFEELASKYPEFQKEYHKIQAQKKSSGKSFSSLVTQEFNVALTRASLHFRFGLEMPSLPSDRLCPPVPNRLAYVQWIHGRLLPLLSNVDYFEEKADLQQCGIDIGTGASCIYPLLFCRGTGQGTTTWKLLATEVDPVSVAHAQANVDANQLGDSIHVALVRPTNVQARHSSTNKADGCIKRGGSGGPVSQAMKALTGHSMWTSTDLEKPFDFVMTNPPFYDDDRSSERTDLRAGDDRARTPMTAHEGSHPGGEVGFVLDIVRDSLVIQRGISWYTAMLGKKTSFLQLRGILTQLLGPGHVQTMEIGPGRKTRWLLAWTYQRPQKRSPACRVSRGSKHFEVQIQASNEVDAVTKVVERVSSYFESFPQGKLSCKTLSVGGSQNKVLVAVCDEDRPPVSRSVDEREDVEPIPQRLIDGIHQEWNAQVFLPRDGHFWIDISIKTLHHDVNRNLPENEPIVVSIALDCYSHSATGGKVISKIRNQLEGEVSRTNRKWRRIQKRHLKDDDAVHV